MSTFAQKNKQGFWPVSQFPFFADTRRFFSLANRIGQVLFFFLFKRFISACLSISVNKAVSQSTVNGVYLYMHSVRICVPVFMCACEYYIVCARFSASTVFPRSTTVSSSTTYSYLSIISDKTRGDEETGSSPSQKAVYNTTLERHSTLNKNRSDCPFMPSC